MTFTSATPSSLSTLSIGSRNRVAVRWGRMKRRRA